MLKLYDVRGGRRLARARSSALAALLIVGPQEPFSDEELRRIDQYVMRGGSLGVFGGALAVDLAGGAGPSARPVSSRVDELVGAWGVRLTSKVVADAQCSRAPMRGPMGLQVLVPYPPIPVLQLDEEQLQHPVMFRLASPMLPFVAPLEVGDSPPDAQITVLATIVARLVDDVGAYDLPRATQPSGLADDLRGRTIRLDGGHRREVALCLQRADGRREPQCDSGSAGFRRRPSVCWSRGPAHSSKTAFMPPRPQQGDVQMNAALALALNGIDWLAADSDLIAIRAKTIEEPALDIPDSVLAAEDTALAAAEAGDEDGRRIGAVGTHGRDRILGHQEARISLDQHARDSFHRRVVRTVPVATALEEEKDPQTLGKGKTRNGMAKEPYCDWSRGVFRAARPDALGGARQGSAPERLRRRSR